MVTEKDIEQFSKQCSEIFTQISRDVIGQKPVVEGTVIAMIAGGNVLLEGVPGVGKTRLVRSLGRVFDLPFSRIQFTPDLMPADVTGTNIIVKDEKGPIPRSASSRDPYSAILFSPMKSTAPRPRRSRRSSKPCRSIPLRLWVCPGSCPNRSLFSLRRTPSSRTALIPCPKRRWTAYV